MWDTIWYPNNAMAMVPLDANKKIAEYKRCYTILEFVLQYEYQHNHFPILHSISANNALYFLKSERLSSYRCVPLNLGLGIFTSAFQFYIQYVSYGQWTDWGGKKVVNNSSR